MTDVNLKFVALVFGIIFLVVLLVRRAVKKVNKERQENKGRIYKKEPSPVKPDLSEEQFNRSWKSLSYLLLLAAAGSLYMVYNGIRSALAADLTAWQILFWIDAILSLAAAAAAVVVWQTRSKLWVYVYFFLTLVPIVIFMSVKGDGVKLNALVHLFPLVLFYFVLQPVWKNMKN